MPNPLDRYRDCSQAPHWKELEAATQAADRAQFAFQNYVYNMPREAPLTGEQWREFNRVRAQYFQTAERRERAFFDKEMCQTVYTLPPRNPTRPLPSTNPTVPQLDPPK